jgi:hypothetical protein
MGAPALDYFCENGHHIDGCGHHELMIAPKKCQHCGSNMIGCVFEWCDDEYEQAVPFDPIAIKEKIVKIDDAIDALGNPIEAYKKVKVEVFDVSNLSFKEAKVPTCPDCGSEMNEDPGFAWCENKNCPS